MPPTRALIPSEIENMILAQTLFLAQTGREIDSDGCGMTVAAWKMQAWTYHRLRSPQRSISSPSLSRVSPGALIAARRDFDITGVIFLAIISGLGGGILRDTLIQRGTPVAFTNSNYLIVAFAAAAIGFFFSQRMGRIDWVFTMFSALSLGLYTLVGVQKGLDAGLPTLSVLMLGIITAAGGEFCSTSC